MTNSRPPGDQETPSQTTRKDVEGTWGITPKIVLWLPWPHMHTCIIDRQKMVKREHPTKGGAWEAALGYMHTKKDVLSWSVGCSYDHLLALFSRTISPLLPTPTFSSQHTQLRKCTWVIPKLGTSILEVAYIYKEKWLSETGKPNTEDDVRDTDHVQGTLPWTASLCPGFSSG